MRQKVHPVRIRLGHSVRSRSEWHTNKTYYSFFVLEDYRIRKFITQNRSSEAKIFQVDIIRHFRARVNNHMGAYPTPIAGTDESKRVVTGSLPDQFKRRPHTLNEVIKIRILRTPHNFFNLENFRSLTHFRRGVYKEVESLRRRQSRTLHLIEQFEIFVQEPKHLTISSQYFALLIASEIEARTPFRRAIRYRITYITDSEIIHGFRVQVSGRLGGSDIARAEWMQKGQVPLSTFSATLDYSCSTAHTVYGSLGVKVWVFYRT
jgi:ribosomal protein S3